MSWLLQTTSRTSGSMLRRSLTPLAFNRGYRSTIPLLQQQSPKGSLFGDVSEYKESSDSRLAQLSHRSQTAEVTTSEDGEKLPHQKPLEKLTNKDLTSDPEVLKIIKPKAETAVEKLLSPLKQKLYLKALELNNGNYVPNQLIKLDDKTYKLNLSKDELNVLEPSVYIQSYRIKSSLKKTYPFLRMLRGLDLNKAITQCHFSAKQVSRDVGEMLERGIQQAKDLNLDPSNLYVEQIWVGKDGTKIRRMEFKGRGRVGTVTHNWVHVKAILRQVSHREDKNQSKTAKVDNQRVWEQLKSRPVHYSLDNSYKW